MKIDKETTTSEPIQIDPPGCGCTECITGQYVPMDRATAEQMAAMLYGEIGDATSEDFTLTTVAEHYLSDTPQPVRYAMTLTATYSGRTWRWTVEQLPSGRRIHSSLTGGVDSETNKRSGRAKHTTAALAAADIA